MTCVVGVVDKKSKEVWIGADSAGVAGLDITRRKDKKVFKNGEFVIGCTSSFRMIQLLQYSFAPPKINEGQSLEHYMATSFIDAVRKCFKDGGYLTTDKGVDEGGKFLVGVRGRLFTVDSDFQVGESMDNFDAVGCGEPYAKGAMYEFRKMDLDPERLIKDALEAAEYFSAGVSAPFHVVTTEE